MSTFLVDSKNDLVLVGDTFQIESGLHGALLAAKHYAQTLRGEMIHDMQSGVRFFDTVFNASRLQLFEMDFRRRVMQLADVRAVTDFDARIDGHDLVYSATIETIYGAGVINSV